MKKIIIFLLMLVPPVLAADQEPSLPKGLLKLTAYPAPATHLSDIDGISFSLEQYKGHWVFVHFWASWCGPCRKEMPAIQRMWKSMKSSGLKIALINTAEDEDTVFSFLSAHAPEIRALMDSDGQVTEKWQPRGLPSTYLIGPKGQVHYQAIGGRPWDNMTYHTFLQNLLKNKL